MDKTLIIVSAVVGSLGVLSAIFGFAAEGTKLTPYTIQLTYGGDCFYPPNPAVGLGVCAVIFLLVSQVTISAVGGYCGCCKSRSIVPSETKRIVGIVCAVFSWIAAVIAMVLFIYGASWNTTGVRAASNCRWLKDGIFAGAAVLALAATALGVTSYIMMRTQRVAKAESAPSVPLPLPPEGEPKLPPAAATATATQGSGSPTLTTPPTMASAPPEPGELTTTTTTAAAAAAEAEMVGQPSVQPPPQVGVPNDPIQQGSSSGQLVRDELTRAGIKLAARVVEHAIFSDGIVSPTIMPGIGDILVSMTDLQSTDAVAI